MPTVIKRDGNKELFDPGKVRRSIEKAAIDAGLELKRRKDIIEKVAKGAIRSAKEKGEITTGALREQILKQLDTVEQRVSDAWRRFDGKYKKR